MIAKRLLCWGAAVAAFTCGYVQTASGWASTAWWDEHWLLASRILEEPSLNYVCAMYGLSIQNIADRANTEDGHNPPTKPISGDYSWGVYGTLDGLHKSWCAMGHTEKVAGMLLHVLCDNAVPVDHSPASSIGWKNQDAENMFEAATAYSNPPAWPNPPYYAGAGPSDYAGQINQHYLTVRGQAGAFKNHYNAFYPCQICRGQCAWYDVFCWSNTAELGLRSTWCLTCGTEMGGKFYQSAATEAMRLAWTVFWEWGWY